MTERDRDSGRHSERKRGRVDEIGDDENERVKQMNGGRERKKKS